MFSIKHFVAQFMYVHGMLQTDYCMVRASVHNKTPLTCTAITYTHMYFTCILRYTYSKVSLENKNN